MLWILIILVLVIVAGKVLESEYNFEYLGIGLMMISGMVLILTLFAWPASYYSKVDEIQQYHSTKQTIEISRENEMTELERAALTTKIIEVNRWLASLKYWNETIFDMYIPDEVMELEYLK